MNRIVFSREKDEWLTPKKLFDDLNKEFHFELDPCTTEANPLGTKKFNTIISNGLTTEWNCNVFINPPYSKIKDWVKKAYEENKKYGFNVVMLLPVRTSNKWFHEFIYNKAEIRFIKGRLKFSNSLNSAPFPSMIVIFRGKH